MINLELQHSEVLRLFESLLRCFPNSSSNDVLVTKLRTALLKTTTDSEVSWEPDAPISPVNNEKFDVWQAQQLKKIQNLTQMEKSITDTLDNLRREKKKARG